MKNTFISILNIPILYFIMGFNAFAFGQTEGTAINGNLGFKQIGNTPMNASAIIEMKSTNKGMLLPRLTTAQINAVSSPAQGLMLYDTDAKCVKTYNGSAWECLDSNPPAALTPLSNSYAQKVNGNADNNGYGIVSDASGNIYSVGEFSNTITVGKGSNTSTLTSQGNWDGFFVKYNSTGDIQWAVQIAGTNYQTISDIAIDASSNLYIVGTLRGNTTFYSNSTSPTYVTSVGQDQAFFAKYNTNGELLWYKTATTSNGYNARAISVAIDASNNAYVAGYFSGNLVLGSINMTSNSNSEDISLLKLNSSDGAFLWARSAGGTDSDQSIGVSVDGTGNAYLTGYYRGTATFGVSPTTTTFTSRGGRDIFVAKYNTSGSFLWVKTAGSVNDDTGDGVVVDNAGNNVYIVGLFSGTLSFGPGLGTNSVVSTGSNDVLLYKLNGNGDFVWRTNAGGTSSDEGYDVAIDNTTGNVYITGRVYADVAFKNASNNDSFPLSTCNSYDPFVASYSPLGNLNWAILATGGSGDNGNAISFRSGTAYATGIFYYTTSFGYQQLVGNGFANTFIWRYAE
jgi:Beta-propeller repeat